MGYTSPIAWVDAGNPMSEWTSDRQVAPDPEIQRAMAAPPSLYPVRHPIRDQPVGFSESNGAISASYLVGKFIV